MIYGIILQDSSKAPFVHDMRCRLKPLLFLLDKYLISRSIRTKYMLFSTGSPSIKMIHINREILARLKFYSLCTLLMSAYFSLIFVVMLLGEFQFHGNKYEKTVVTRIEGKDNHASISTSLVNRNG